MRNMQKNYHWKKSNIIQSQKIQSIFEHIDTWWANHFVWQRIPILENSVGKKVLTRCYPENLLAELQIMFS